MRRMFAVVGTLMALTLVISNVTVNAAAAFAHPAFMVAWQRGEAGYPNFWGPLALAHDGQAEQYVEGNLNGQAGQRLVQYFDKARMELTNTANPTGVSSGLLATELITGKRQLGDNTFEQHNPANINIAGDPGSESLTYLALGKVAVKDTQRPVADLKPPIAFVNGQFQASPVLQVPGLPATPQPLVRPVCAG